ncbi:MAG: PBP1A family penicillin-binding protein [Deltaproteobacteria bacterium]
MAGRRKTGRRAALHPFKAFLFGILTLLSVALAASFFLIYREFSTGLPPVEKLLDYNPPVATRVLAADGTLIGEFFIEKRYLTPIYKIPKAVQLAFLAAEDSTFYEHFGLDPVGILRAFFANTRSGKTRQGGSTITQQVVKQLLLSPERSYERKLREAILALRLETELTKSQILSLYLNQIYLGAGAYGVQAASREYFGNDVADISLAEAALLAGLPQAPSRYSPNRHFKRAKARQRYVLRRMQEEGYISAAEAQAAEQEEIHIGNTELPAETGGPAPWYLEQVRRLLLERYGASGTYRLGLIVETPLDLSMQEAAERALGRGLHTLDQRQGYRGPLRRLNRAEWRSLLPAEGAARTTAALPESGMVLEVVVLPGPSGQRRTPDGGLYLRWAGGFVTIPPAGLGWIRRAARQPGFGDVLEARVLNHDGKASLALTENNDTQGALVAMAPASGDVKALIGGRNHRDSEFDRAIQSRRQPGSAFKPLIFAAAVDHGYTPSSIIDDSPVTFDDLPGKPWSPKNFSKRFYGPTTLRKALTQSRNVVAVKLVHAMGLPYLLDYLPNFGFERRFAANLSISLGTGQTSLLEMVRAYGVFAEGGTLVEPRFITRIIDQHGNILEERPPRRRATLRPETAYIVTRMMRGVMERGTGRRARIGRPAAGKTGTTNDLRDAWFLGFTPDLIAGVWVGYDRDKTLGPHETGGRVAAPIWKDFMSHALAGTPVSDFVVPANIVLVAINPETGRPAEPGQKDTVLEAFRRGTEPRPFTWGGSPGRTSPSRN